MRRDVIFAKNVILMGKLTMKLFGSGLFGRRSRLPASAPRSCCRSRQATPSRVARLPALTAHGPATARSTLSDGTTEHIRCKADYKVNDTGLGLKQNLRCASDSYKFDLSSDVTSQGDRISGNWSEASRNIFGNLQGTAGGGQIEVFVEAAGFAANLTLRTNGNKQIVQINSKGEIRGVTITMVEGLTPSLETLEPHPFRLNRTGSSLSF